MKKLLAVVGLVMAVFSMQASAASTLFPSDGNLGLVTDSTGFLHTGIARGSFTDVWTFSTAATGSFSGNASNSFSFNIKSVIKDFSATLDGNAFTSTPSPGQNYLSLVLASLSAGSHVLSISGISGGNASYTGNIAVAQTPIPGAVWLFGSALMGLMGARRKKA